MADLSGIFLGTGASELVPSVWCMCDRCRVVRELGGRNRRRNAAFFLHPDILIDLPPELPSQAWDCGVHLGEVQHLVITHAHGDHLYPNWLKWRQGPLPGDRPVSGQGPLLDDRPVSGQGPLPGDRLVSGDRPLPDDRPVSGQGPLPGEPGTAEPLRRSYVFPRFGELATLNVWGSPRVIEIVRTALKDDLSRLALRLHSVSAGKRFVTGDVWWLPFDANHRCVGDTPYNYVIGRGDATWLYGLDSGGFDEEAWRLLGEFRFDAVILDATAGDAYTEATPYHLNLEKIRATANTLREKGLLRPGGQIYLSHLNNHHWPPHDQLVPRLAAEGLTVAFDGMRVGSF